MFRDKTKRVINRVKAYRMVSVSSGSPASTQSPPQSGSSSLVGSRALATFSDHTAITTIQDDDDDEGDGGEKTSSRYDDREDEEDQKDEKGREKE